MHILLLAFINNCKQKETHCNYTLSCAFHMLTHVIYEKCRKKNPCCTLVLMYQHVKVARSRKYHCPFMTVKASCSFTSCNAHYIFRIRQKPLSSDKRIPVQVTRIGKVTHLKGEVGSRPASYQKSVQRSK